MSTSKQTNKEVPTQPQPWLISGKSTLSKTQLQLTTTRSGRLNMTSSGGKEGTPFSKQAPMASLSSTQPSQGYALRPMASFSATQPQKGNALYSSTPLNFNQQGQQQQQGYALRPSPSLSYTPQQQQQQQQQQMYALRSTASLNYIQPMQGYGQQQQQQQQQFSLYSSQSRGAFKCQAPQWFVMPQQKYVSPLPCSEDSDSSSSDEEAEGRNILPNLDEMEKIYGDSYKKHKLSTSLKNMGITDYRKISNLCKSFIVEKEASGKLNKYETNIEDGMGIAVYTYEDEEVSNGAVCPFRVINTCLSKTRTLEALNKIKDTFFNIVTGLRKLPRFYPSSKTLYRGIRERVDLEMYTKGKTVTWSAFSSASTDMSVIKNFLSSSGDAYGTMFIIQGDPWGYDITDFSFFEDEREILLEPDRRFEVSSIMDQGQLVIIELKMLETLLVIESLVPPLGPLREGWIFKKDTSTGKIFYVDCSTGKSQWERPSAPAIQPAPAPVLPSGWIEMVDPASGRKYYCDTISKRTQWERPVCPGYLPGQQQPSGAVAVIPVPTGLQAKKLYVDGVSLKWNPVAIQGVNYVVEFCETLQSAQFYRGYSGNKTHCNCSGLKPGLSYSFRVCACVGGGNDDDNDDNDDGGGGGGYNIGTLGNWSALLEVELPPLPAPVNVKTTTINADAVGVSWAIPQMSVLNPASVSYHVRKTIGQQNTLDYEGAALRYICKDIQAGFSYKFFVRMLCNGAIGPWSAPATTQARAICLQYAGHFKEGPNYKIIKDGRTARAEIDCWCSNVVGNAPIPPDVVVKWTVKVIKTRNSGDGIFIGVAPQSIDVESNSNRRDCGWYFCCYDSSLYAGPPYNYGEYFGERYASSGALGDGNEVSVYVDMSSRAISFYVNGKDFGIAYKNVPTNEPLVPVVIITYKEDTVRLI